MNKQLPLLTLVFVICGAVIATAQPGSIPPGGPPPAPESPPPAPVYGQSQPGYYQPQPAYAQQPEPTGFFDRRGMTYGFGLGLGRMYIAGEPFQCDGCSYSPVAVGADLHIGGMLNPRLALMFEFDGNAQQLDDYGSTMLVQSNAMVAGQYWLAPRFWIKAGVGISDLAIHYDDGYSYLDQNIDSGIATLGAIGFEIAASRTIAVDLQLRVSNAFYSRIDDDVGAITVRGGVSWYR